MSSSDDEAPVAISRVQASTSEKKRRAVMRDFVDAERKVRKDRNATKKQRATEDALTQTAFDDEDDDADDAVVSRMRRAMRDAAGEDDEDEDEDSEEEEFVFGAEGEDDDGSEEDEEDMEDDEELSAAAQAAYLPDDVFARALAQSAQKAPKKKLNTASQKQASKQKTKKKRPEPKHLPQCVHSAHVAQAHLHAVSELYHRKRACQLRNAARQLARLLFGRLQDLLTEDWGLGKHR